MQLSQGEQVEPKRTRHTRLSPVPGSRIKQGQLPSPITNKESTSEVYKDRTESPPKGRPSQANGPPAVRSPKVPGGLSSPPSDTQPFSQFIQPGNRTYAVEDEEGEEVWGYLVPTGDHAAEEPLVLRRRQGCPVPSSIVGKVKKGRVSRGEYKEQEENYEEEKAENGLTSGGYLIGRHRECGRLPFMGDVRDIPNTLQIA